MKKIDFRTVLIIALVAAVLVLAGVLLVVMP